jgi:hypothetical protein
VPEADQARDGLRRIRALALTILAGVAASAMLLWITQEAPGISPDSTNYIQAAQSLLAGRGLSINGEPMTHFPPVYPLLLAAAIRLLPGSSLDAARLLGAFFMGVNVLLLSSCIRIYTRNSLLATACAALACLSSAPTILAHAMAWSEGPFITFLLSAFLFLSSHTGRLSEREALLLLATTSLALMTRYVGIALLPAVGLALFVRGEGSGTLRARRAVSFMAAACLPLAAWSIRNILTSGTVANRRPAMHSVTNLLGGSIALVVVLLLLLLGRFRARVASGVGSVLLPVVCLAFATSYVAFLVISMSFSDAATGFDERILLPVALALTIAGISLPWSLAQVMGDRRIWHACVFVLIVPTIAVNGRRAVAMAVDFREHGRGYTSRQWRQSETLRYVADIDARQKVFSNGADAIGLMAGRAAGELPWKGSPTSLLPNVDYAAQLKAVVSECRDGQAVIVYFDAIDRRAYLPSREELASTASLPVLAKLRDGVVFGKSLD